MVTSSFNRKRMRPKNNVVDITNYVMLEMGQIHYMLLITIQSLLKKLLFVKPLLQKQTENIGWARSWELVEGDIIIMDGQTPIAIAGDGRANTEVTDNTTNVY